MFAELAFSSPFKKCVFSPAGGGHHWYFNHSLSLSVNLYAVVLRRGHHIYTNIVYFHPLLNMFVNCITFK